MGPLANTVFVRLAALLLAAVVLFNVAMALALFAPVGRERAELYLLPLPTQAAAIVDVLEATPPEGRARVLDALNSRSTRVSLLDDMPELGARRPVTRPLERFFRRYDAVFADHEFHLDMQRRRPIERLIDKDAREDWRPNRLYVRLEDGVYVLIEPARAAALDTFLARGLAFVGAAGILVVIGLILAVRQTAKPVTALAAHAHTFADRLDAPDFAESGPKELRELARAFNHMKARIRMLVDERTRVLAAIAHDLRTYLTRLRLRADFIEDPDQRARAERDIAEMSALVEDTLQFARATEGRSEKDARVNLRIEIESFAAARAELGEPVSVQGTPDADIVAAIEPVALRRILANLTDNAVRYGGAARISAFAEDECRVVVQVEDDGPGVRDSDLERVVEPFERLEPSRSREGGGAGLGLAIVRALAEAHGGSLCLANGESGGLVASVTLPTAGPSGPGQ